MEDYFTINGYNITTDPEYNRKRYGITPQLQKQMDILFFECREKNNNKAIEKLLQLIAQYPGVPMLKNYLSIAYLSQGRQDKVEEVNRQLLEKHPDYLFGLVNKANFHIDKKEFDQVLETLGPQLELKALCPECDLFHLAELTAFLKVVIRYYAAIKDHNKAEESLEFMKEIAPDHPDTDTAEALLFALRLEKAAKRHKEEQENSIKPVVLLNAQETDFETVPVFIHSETLCLYQYGLGIPHEKINELLRLPAETFAKDLEEMLTDAVHRYGYFKKQGWKEETHTFVIHALLLLGEIKAENALPGVLNFLSYNTDFLDFWLGDHLTETIWQSVYKLGLHKTQDLGDFLKKPGIETYCKTLASDALCQIVHHQPERKNEIVAVLTDVLNTFINAHPNDNLIDSDLLGLITIDFMDVGLGELLPYIKQLYGKFYIPPSICGTWEDVEKDFSIMTGLENTKEIKNIFELYDDITNTWSSYNSEEDKDEEDYNDNEDYNNEPYIRTEKKVGRNDPCPCGSGKKYKKCCLKQ